ncbi:MAG TPA: FG-GAP-like repeat-containing protein, partial [Pyrinomonadaceae bacterium]|nr:FG-GAP-like repeat-containing protein [Pyrinomonadaceae bacterium]
SADSVVKAFYQPDGKILAVAQVHNTSSQGPQTVNLHLLRYSNNGALEGTIGGIINFGVRDALQQPDGKIVAVGQRYGDLTISPPRMADWIIARFNPDGTLDTTFNSTGIATRGFAQNEDSIRSVALQAGGKILVCGSSSNNSGTATVVGRYNADGSVDAAFGPYGEGFFDRYDNGALSVKVLVKPDGKFLLTGSGVIGSLPSRLVVMQFNNNGTLDTTFANQGVAVVNYTLNEFLYDASLAANGKIVLLASSSFNVSGTSYTDHAIHVVRLNADSSLDTGFGADGRTILNSSSPRFPGTAADSFAAGWEAPAKLLVRENGDIFVLGTSLQPVISRRNEPGILGRAERKYLLIIFRLNPDGKVAGKNFTRVTPANQAVSAYNNFEHFQPNGILVQPDGKILVYGTVDFVNFQIFSPSSRDPAIFLARYSSISTLNDTNNFYDYNFDGKAEFAVYRPNNSGLGTWLFLLSHPRGDPTYQLYSREYGSPGDIIAPGDYDGDGIQDLAVFRPATGEWITRKVYLNNCAPMSCAETIQFGASGDIPAPGDFDGDGKTDRAVFRPSGGDWYILFSTGGYTGFHFGQNGDKPVTGDYDGDGKSDAAVIRRENGKIFWYISQSSDGAFVAFQFGNSEDKTAVADYNGDGKTEVAVWRPSNGTFYALANYTDFSYLQLGSNGDVPMPADFDGDKKDDFAVYTPSNGAHTFVRSSDGLIGGTQFGLPADIPVASAYVR